MDSENKNEINNKTLINATYYFESLVLSSINKRLEDEKKSALNKNIKVGKFFAINTIMPDGIYGLNGQRL